MERYKADEKLLRRVRTASEQELVILAGEIRKKITEDVSKNGGHLASNLGVVELTLALHRVFNTPEDKVVWDVGHQCYAHKLITGRWDAFESLRTHGGITLTGFTRLAHISRNAAELSVVNLCNMGVITLQYHNGHCLITPSPDNNINNP